MAQPPPPAGPGIPAAAGGVAILTASPTSYAQLYQDATKDPYHGDYTAVMRTFRDTAAAYSAHELFDLARNVNLDTPNFYIGLYNRDGEEGGRSYTLHGFATYAPTLGMPTEWDGNTYAFLQDVSPLGDIITVATDHLLFARTQGVTYSNVPATAE
ncbi:hypothetical protein ACA910_010602 [Epithemia clementina (nom. ined.)]